MRILIKNARIVQPGETARKETKSIGIEDDTILFVGDTPFSFIPDTEIDALGKYVMPGFVNGHTHSAMTILRNYADDLSFSDWLFNKIIPAETKLTEEDVYWGTMLGVVEMIKSGTTTFADMYQSMDRVADAVKQTGIRANLCYGPITSAARNGVQVVDRESCSSYINKWNNAEGGRFKSFVEIHSVYLFDRESIKEAAVLAKELNTGIHIHISESATELATCKEKYGLTPVEACLEWGIFDVPVLAAHCVWLEDGDFEILKAKGVNIAHCPSSNLKIGNGFAPVSRMLENDINVCLGTDGCASNNNLNMMEEMHLAALIHKGVNKNPQCLSAEQSIGIATVNGARALGFDDVGLIKPEYKADIIIIDPDKPHMCPDNNAASSIVYSAQASDITDVIVNGKVLMRNKELLTIDEEKAKKMVSEISKRIKE